MDSIETFLSDFVLKALLHSFPNLSTDDQTKVQKAVADWVTAGMDVASIYFLLRSAKSAAPAK